MGSIAERIRLLLGIGKGIVLLVGGGGVCEGAVGACAEVARAGGCSNRMSADLADFFDLRFGGSVRFERGERSTLKSVRRGFVDGIFVWWQGVIVRRHLRLGSVICRWINDVGSALFHITANEVSGSVNQAAGHDESPDQDQTKGDECFSPDTGVDRLNEMVDGFRNLILGFSVRVRE
jgi:hypothetical protein